MRKPERRSGPTFSPDLAALLLCGHLSACGDETASCGHSSSNGPGENAGGTASSDAGAKNGSPLAGSEGGSSAAVDPARVVPAEGWSIYVAPHTRRAIHGLSQVDRSECVNLAHDGRRFEQKVGPAKGPTRVEGPGSEVLRLALGGT